MPTKLEVLGVAAMFDDGPGSPFELPGEADAFELPWNGREPASRIGTVRGIVSRTPSRMTHEGAIRTDAPTVTILDRASL